MTTPAGFAAKMATLAVSIPTTTPRALFAAGQFVEKTIESNSPSVLRNVGRGARVGAKTHVPKVIGPFAEVMVSATGPFQLIERSIQPHLIEPKRFGAAVNNPLKIPGSDTGFAAYAKHPGVSRSSGPFARGVRIASPAVPRIIHEAIYAQMRAVI